MSPTFEAGLVEGEPRHEEGGLEHVQRDHTQGGVDAEGPKGWKDLWV